MGAPDDGDNFEGGPVSPLRKRAMMFAYEWDRRFHGRGTDEQPAAPGGFSTPRPWPWPAVEVHPEDARLARERLNPSPRAPEESEQPAAPPGFRQVNLSGGGLAFVPVADPPAPVARAVFKIPPSAIVEKQPAGSVEIQPGVFLSPEPSAAPAVPQPGVPACESAHGDYNRCICAGGHNWRCRTCEDAECWRGTKCQRPRAPVTPAAVQGERPLSADIRALIPLVRKTKGDEDANNWEWVADRVAALEARLAATKALADSRYDEAVEAEAERDKLGRERDEARAQLATRDAHIAELEASSADLVRRAQEAEERLASTDRAHEALTERFNAACDDAAELRGKLAAAERGWLPLGRHPNGECLDVCGSAHDGGACKFPKDAPRWIEHSVEPGVRGPRCFCTRYCHARYVEGVPVPEVG